MKQIIATCLIPLFFASHALAVSEDTHCSLFLKNVESTFEKGIDHIDHSRHHMAYDAFGETLMRIRSESKYLEDCEESERRQMIRVQEESARTLTALRGQM